MKLTVETDGRVSAVTPQGELADSAFGQCVAKAVAGWTFPKHDTPHAPIEATFKF